MKHLCDICSKGTGSEYIIQILLDLNLIQMTWRMEIDNTTERRAESGLTVLRKRRNSLTKKSLTLITFGKKKTHFPKICSESVFDPKLMIQLCCSATCSTDVQCLRGNQELELDKEATSQFHQPACFSSEAPPSTSHHEATMKRKQIFFPAVTSFI